MKKDVAVVEKKPFAIMEMSKEQIKSLIKDNLAGESIDANTDLTRIKVPSGGGTTWTIPTVEGEIETKELVGILVCHQLVRSYWESAYTGEGVPPDCSSMDCITGEGNPGGPCLECPYAEFGSDPKEESNAQACSQNRLMYFVLQDELIPVAVKAPPTSLKNSKKFLLGLTSRQYEISSIYTKLTLEKTKSQQGMDYSQIIFTSAGKVENPELTKAYADQIKPFLMQTVPDMVNK